MLIEIEHVELANETDRKRLAFALGLPPESSAETIARHCNAHQRAAELRRAIPTLSQERALQLARVGS